MVEKICENPDIFKIYIPLPNNPLKNLNCYVVKTPNKNLIIDTGFNMPECLAALREGLNELHIDIKNTELFLTHLHSDHIGIANTIMEDDSVIYMSEIDYQYLNLFNDMDLWTKTEELFVIEGFPENSISVLRSTNPARSYAPDGSFTAHTVQNGEKIKIGDYIFECILTPGHTPGHMCLYYKSNQILFLGDHVLFDITPNITSWYGVPDSLDDYMKSLHKIKSYSVSLALPAHRKNEMELVERIEQILQHHQIRLYNTMSVITKSQGMTAYEIASKMKWSMRGKDWSEFPMSQKWFAMGETLSHLDYLINRKNIYKKQKNGQYRYYLNS